MSIVPDPVIEYYKQFVDRDKLRANLRLTVEQRSRNLRELAVAKQRSDERNQAPPSPQNPWQPVSDCGPNRTTDPIVELYKRDVDRTLLRENLRRTPEERFQALVSMAILFDEFQTPARGKGPA
jgi:hypothetical protein